MGGLTIPCRQLEQEPPKTEGVIECSRLWRRAGIGRLSLGGEGSLYTWRLSSGEAALARVGTRGGLGLRGLVGERALIGIGEGVRSRLAILGGVRALGGERALIGTGEGARSCLTGRIGGGGLGDTCLRTRAIPAAGAGCVCGMGGLGRGTSAGRGRRRYRGESDRALGRAGSTCMISTLGERALGGRRGEGGEEECLLTPLTGVPGSSRAGRYSSVSASSSSSSSLPKGRRGCWSSR